MDTSLAQDCALSIMPHRNVDKLCRRLFTDCVDDRHKSAQNCDHMQVGELIRRARESKGIERQELADKTANHLNTIANIETGKTKPSAARLVAIVRALGYDSLDELKYRIAVKPQFQHGADDIPVFDKIPAGNGDHDDGGYDRGVAESYVPRRAMGVEDPMAYAVKVDGDSMMPTLQPGEMIICSPTEVQRHGFEDGRVYAFRFTSEIDLECTVKRVQKRGDDELDLIPDNPTHERRTVRHEHIAHAARVVKRCGPGR